VPADTYADLEIRILEKQDRGYPVEITLNGDQEFPRGFLDPAAEPEIERAKPRETGVRLFQWLFGSRELLAAWTESRGRCPLRRIRLRVDATAPALHAVPWELLEDPCDGTATQTVAAMEATPFSRYLAGQWTPGHPILRRPIRILVAIANPGNLEKYGLSSIDSEQEWNLLRDAVGGESGVELVRLAGACSLAAIESALRKGIHILHFVGHGRYLKDSGQSVLYLADENNRVVPAQDSAIASMLARQLMDAAIASDDKLRLVHLSSCQTAVRNPADAFRGLAPQLVAGGVPAVIAMQDVVPAAAAHAFSSVFYRELLDHGEVDRAANAARSSLLTAGIRGAGIPVLFMRLRFGQLFANRRFGVFLSYNAADRALVEELAHKLTDSGEQPWFDQWHVSPGTSLDAALEEALSQSSSCAVFMGPGGLAPWQNERVRLAIDQRVHRGGGEFRVIPVLLPGARREERSKLPTFLVATPWVEFSNSLDDDNAIHHLLCGIRGQEPGAQPGAEITIEGNPYRGLEYFDVEHQPSFFGREALLEWLLDVLRPAPGKTENRFLALVGPSGAGKSSLARAGLLATIQAGGLPGSREWLICHFRPGAEPLENLAIALVSTTGGEKTPAAIRRQVDEFRKDERTLHLSVRLALDDAPPRRLVLLADQFEEAFTQCGDETARRALIDNLMAAANTPGGQTIVVLTLRADLYGECSAYPVLAAAVSDHNILVGPMDDAELRRAIERPALLAGAEFEHGLVDVLLDEVRDQPGSLPLLEYTLRELWQRRDGRRLTHASYQEIGKVAGALERRAEEVYAQLLASERQILQRIFLRLVQSIEGAGAARQRVPMAELVPAGADRKTVDNVVDKLAGPQVRLLTLEAKASFSGAPEQYVDIAHEALIRKWPRLQRWMNEDQEFQLWLKRLNASRLDWERTLRHPDGLLRGALLEEARRWLEARPEDLNREETEFVQAGIFVEEMRREEEAARQREVEEAQQQRLLAEKERADVQAQSALRLRKRAWMLAGLLAAAAALAAAATYQTRVADRERATSSSLYLANVSATVASKDVRVFLALHAVAQSDTREAEEALHRAVQGVRPRWFHAEGQTNYVVAIALSPDGNLLATANSDDTVSFWRVSDKQQTRDPLKIDGGVAGLAFRGNDALVIAGAQGFIRAIAVSGTPLQPDIAVSRPVRCFALAPDGSRVATGNQDSTVVLGPFPSGPLRILHDQISPILSASFSPGDGKYLVSASANGDVIGWDTLDKQAIRFANAGGNPVPALALSPVRDISVTGDAVGTLEVRELPSGRLLARQQHTPQKGIVAVAFSADGRTLVSAAMDGTLKFWDATLAGAIRERLLVLCGSGSQTRCSAVAFLRDGSTAVVGAEDGGIRLFQTDFRKLFAEARDLVDPRQIDAADCRKYLQKPSCELPSGFQSAP
jgi:hypothetical protein